MVVEEYPALGLQERAESEITRSLLSGIMERVPRKMQSHTTGPNDITRTRSSSAPIMPLTTTLDSLLQDQTSDTPIIPPLRNLPAAVNNVQSVAGKDSSGLHRVYQELVSGVSGKPGSQLRTELGTKTARTARKQLDALSPVTLELELQPSLYIP